MLGEPTVLVSGQVTFDDVPTVTRGIGRGLDYSATKARAARGVTVELIQGSRVVDGDVTGEDGAYGVSAPRESEVFVRDRAELGGDTPELVVRVPDNTQDNALYTMDGAPFNTDEADVVRDLIEVIPNVRQPPA